MAHWADEVAEKLSGDSQTLATGISPSGEIHVGNLREIMTAEGVHRVLLERHVACRFLYIADNLDPLRRVYPFLDAARYEPLIGQSLSHIPCPCGEHGSYSEHFLEPFLGALAELEVNVEVVRADELYASGQMDEVIGQALEQTSLIAAILNELTGKQPAAGWSPFDPRCTACRRLTSTSVESFDVQAKTVSFRCQCGVEGTVPFAGGGKLTWRVDWPARWKVLGVTLEPFGKDHASRGGSYDSGVRIVREVFGSEPPFPVPYEWISLKGKGDMAASKGNVLSISGMLRVVPPALLRYLILRTEPQRTIRFDPGLPLLSLYGELEDADNKNRNHRAVELARVKGHAAVPVPFRHLVTVAQVASFDAGKIREVLRRTGYEIDDVDALATRVNYVRRWLQEFAPEEIRFAVAEALPPQASELSGAQKAFLAELARRLPEKTDGEALHAMIYALIKERGDEAPAIFFQALYLAFIGKERGPRAGHFLAALDPALVRARLQEAAGA